MGKESGGELFVTSKIGLGTWSQPAQRGEQKDNDRPEVESSMCFTSTDLREKTFVVPHVPGFL